MTDPTEHWHQTTISGGVTTPPAGAAAGQAPEADRIRDTIQRALADGPPHRYDDLTALDVELREHIGQLLPAAQSEVDGLWRGSAEWCSRQTVLDGIRRLLAQDIGDGLQSAAWHVQRLARACSTLLDRTP